MTAPAAPGAAFSVVVPAHDEERVLGRCLRSFVPDLRPGEAEVVVVANGCTDRTAEVARSFPGVVVVEVAAASKPGALDAGDAAVAAFPRVYLDADVTVSVAAIRAVVAALGEPGVHAAAPRARFDLAGRPAAVRSFYRAYQRMPYLSEALVGTGFYALSAEGRARFGRFPALTADDLFVQRLFDRSERVVLADREFVVQAPRTLRALLAVRTRVAFGNAELAASDPADAAVGASTGGSVASLVRMARADVRRVPDVAVYVGVTAAARARAARRRGRATRVWDRDDSSR